MCVFQKCIEGKLEWYEWWWIYAGKAIKWDPRNVRNLCTPRRIRAHTLKQDQTHTFTFNHTQYTLNTAHVRRDCSSPTSFRFTRSWNMFVWLVDLWSITVVVWLIDLWSKTVVVDDAIVRQRFHSERRKWSTIWFCASRLLITDAILEFIHLSHSHLERCIPNLGGVRPQFTKRIAIIFRKIRMKLVFHPKTYENELVKRCKNDCMHSKLFSLKISFDIECRFQIETTRRADEWTDFECYSNSP